MQVVASWRGRPSGGTPAAIQQSSPTAAVWVCRHRAGPGSGWRCASMRSSATSGQVIQRWWRWTDSPATARRKKIVAGGNPNSCVTRHCRCRPRSWNNTREG